MAGADGLSAAISGRELARLFATPSWSLRTYDEVRLRRDEASAFRSPCRDERDFR